MQATAVRVSKPVPSLARIQRDPRDESELDQALRVHPNTRYFRRHVPTGRIDAMVVSAAAMNKQIGDFDISSLATRWTRASLLEYVSSMNRVGAGTWVYWPVG